MSALHVYCTCTYTVYAVMISMHFFRAHMFTKQLNCLVNTVKLQSLSFTRREVSKRVRVTSVIFSDLTELNVFAFLCCDQRWGAEEGCRAARPATQSLFFFFLLIFNSLFFTLCCCIFSLITWISLHFSQSDVFFTVVPRFYLSLQSHGYIWPYGPKQLHSHLHH